MQQVPDSFVQSRRDLAESRRAGRRRLAEQEGRLGSECIAGIGWRLHYSHGSAVHCCCGEYGRLDARYPFTRACPPSRHQPGPGDAYDAPARLERDLTLLSAITDQQRSQTSTMSTTSDSVQLKKPTFEDPNRKWWKEAVVYQV